MNKESVESFQNNGAVVLREAFTDWVDLLRQGVKKNIETPGPDARVYHSDGTKKHGGRFFGDYCNWQRISEFAEFIFESPISEFAAMLMGSKSVRLFHEHVLVKEAMTNVLTPWHQDMPYYCIDATETISFWIPLDEVARERTLEIVSGSHLWGRSFRPERFNGQPLNENDGMEPVPDIEAKRDNFNILGWSLRPGDAVAFDFRAIHSAPPNTSHNMERRAFSLRLVGEGARFKRVPGYTFSPPFPDVKLQDGDLLDGPEFPIIFSESAL